MWLILVLIVLACSEPSILSNGNVCNFFFDRRRNFAFSKQEFSKALVPLLILYCHSNKQENFRVRWESSEGQYSPQYRDWGHWPQKIIHII